MLYFFEVKNYSIALANEFNNLNIYFFLNHVLNKWKLKTDIKAERLVIINHER